MPPLSDSEILEQSYSYCNQLTKKQAGNFYYSFLVLPPVKRRAMSVIYAFMRYCDDAVDEPVSIEEKRASIQLCRDQFRQMRQGNIPDQPIFPALSKVIEQYHIPDRYFYELMDGMEMDISLNRYQTFSDLHGYCYRAASVVGLVTLYVFEFKDPRALEYGVDCGIAFQLTNIIRDITEDLDRDRIYLPQEDLDKYGISKEDLVRKTITPQIRELLKYEADHAEEYYQKARNLLPLVIDESRPCLAAMMEIYRSLLLEIINRDYDVFRERVSLSKWRKLKIGLCAWWNFR